MKPAPGLVVWGDFGQRQPQGHEQEGRRPCVIVAVPGRLHPLRFPIVVVVPLTTTALAPAALYPRLTAEAGGLTADSTVLIDQVQALDLRRVARQIGQLTATELAPITAGLRALFAL